MVKWIYNKFSENLFFIRIFNFNNSTYIWNDTQIYIKYANMNSSLLSVIIPNYNNELTIKNTIDSILENNYKNFEIIIIDDCSNN